MPVEERSDPPPAPQIQRRIVGYPAQWVGIALLALLPVLAIAGVVGENDTEATTPLAGGVVEVTYPSRIGHRSAGQISIVLRARDATLPPSAIHIDDTYLSHFAVLNAWPSFDAFDRVELPEVPAGEAARLVLEVRPNRFGRRSGVVSVVSGGDTIRIAIATLVFP